VLISLSQIIEPVDGYTTESLMHSQCDARPTVTFPAIERHCLLTSTNLYCLMTEAYTVTGLFPANCCNAVVWVDQDLSCPELIALTPAEF